MNKHVAKGEIQSEMGRWPSENEFGWRAVDPDFDAAVLVLAREVCPLGWDVADVAPSTFEELCALLDSGQRMKVWSGASGQTIFGSPAVNYAFRAWHDYWHWKGKCSFTFAGEAATAWMQAQHLRQVYGGHPMEPVWRAYLFTEIMGQVIFADLNGRFPENQRLFLKRFIDAVKE